MLEKALERKVWVKDRKKEVDGKLKKIWIFLLNWMFLLVQQEEQKMASLCHPPRAPARLRYGVTIHSFLLTTFWQVPLRQQ